LISCQVIELDKFDLIAHKKLLPKEGACGNERELVMECATFAKHWIYEVSRAGSSFLAWIPSLPKEVHHEYHQYQPEEIVCKKLFPTTIFLRKEYQC